MRNLTVIQSQNISGIDILLIQFNKGKKQYFTATYKNEKTELDWFLNKCSFDFENYNTVCLSGKEVTFNYLNTFGKALKKYKEMIEVISYGTVKIVNH